MSRRELPRDAVVELCIGKRGSGKTFKARERVARLLGLGRDFAIIHDPYRQFEGVYWNSVARFEAAPTVGRINVFRKTPPSELAALALRQGQKGRRVVLLVDELDKLCNSQCFFDDPKWVRGEERKFGALGTVVNYGRHEHVDLVGTVRRPCALHPSVRANADLIFFFAMFEPNDLEWCRTINRTFASRVAQLQPHKCITYDTNNPPTASHTCQFGKNCCLLKSLTE